MSTIDLIAEFTAALHYGPGPHPDGSPQSVHAGGAVKPPPPRATAGQMAFDFGSQAAPVAKEPEPEPQRQTETITRRLIAKYHETPESEDDLGGRYKSWEGLLTPDGRLINISGSMTMHAEAAYYGLHGQLSESDDSMLALYEIMRQGYIRIDKEGTYLGAEMTLPITPQARARLEHIADMVHPGLWAIDGVDPETHFVTWEVNSRGDNAALRLRQQTGIDLRGLEREELARRRAGLSVGSRTQRRGRMQAQGAAWRA
jgi:hypothetical protein